MPEKTQATPDCPCGQGLFVDCCGRFLRDGLTPQSALALMRSRYTAYVLGDEGYLQSTWYGSTRPVGRLIDPAESIKWLALDVRTHHEDGNAATVEYIARYKLGGRAHKLHEISRFVREEDRWFYLDGCFPG